MVYPIAPGQVDFSNAGAAYTPILFAKKLLVVFYLMTVFGAIANTDYEGEIKKYGDTVIIRELPDIEINEYVDGQNLNYQNPSPGKTTLVIDKGFYYGFNTTDVQEAQADVDFIPQWAEHAGQRMKIKVDGRVLSTIYASAHAANTGDAAGLKSGNINLGKPGTPLAVSKSNILDVIVDCGTVLDEQDVPETNRKLVLPAWATGLIKKSDLKDASLAGDGTSIMRNGRIGMIDRFEIFQSNNLHRTVDGTDTVTHSIFCHPVATTFATQLVNAEKLRAQHTFGWLHRGLQVFGFKVVKPEALGHLYITKA